MEAQFWLNLQSHYDMEVALEALEDRLDKEVHPFSRAVDVLLDSVVALIKVSGGPRLTAPSSLPTILVHSVANSQNRCLVLPEKVADDMPQ